MSNNDLKNFILFHANKASIRTTFKTPTDTTSRSSSADLTNLETTSLSSRHLNDSASIANSSLYSLTAQEHYNVRTEKRPTTIKNDYLSLSYDYKPIDWSQESEVAPISDFSVIEQESLLLNDLLYVLVGIEGKYIRIHVNSEKKKCNLAVADGCDKVLKTNVNRIIAFCPLYSLITHFSENYGNCLVNQAFIGFIRSSIKEYFGLIVQLEILHKKNDLTLQKMWYFLNSFKETLEILKHVCQKIKQGDCIGGATLSIMHEKTNLNVGNVKLHDFCLTMIKLSSKPYLKILEKWITEGEIFDPYNEFFIEVKEFPMQDKLRDDYYWENRYVIIKQRLPIFLVKQAEKILKTGKYINVIRQIRKDIELPYCEELEYSSEDHLFNERIDLAYNFSSKELLNLLFEECNLIEHIKSIKLYFFMEKGDFIVEFMNTADDELNKEMHEIVPTRLESLLELAIRTSVVNSDPHVDNLGIGLVNESILDQFSNVMECRNETSFAEDDESLDDDFHSEMRGFEAIGLKYKVEWPLTLVFSKKNMACYQMMFRYLFYCKFVERELQKVWMQIKNFKHNPMRTSKVTRICSILQKMLEFVLNLEYFMVVEVIEPQFHILLEKISTKVFSIDDMIEEHNKFIETVFNSCMLNERYAFKSMSKLFRFCINFARLIKNNHIDYENKAASLINQINENTLNKNLNCLHADFVENLLYLLEEIIKQQNDNFSASILQISCRLV